MVPDLLTLKKLSAPTRRSIRREAALLAVLVKVAKIPVNVTPLLFQVCERSSTGALAVSVPLLAKSVVKAPLFGVVEPILAGAAKLIWALSKVPLVIWEASSVTGSLPADAWEDAWAVGVRLSLNLASLPSAAVPAVVP